MPNQKKEGENEINKKSCAAAGVFLNRFRVMQVELCFVVVAAAHLDRDLTVDCSDRKWNLNVPNIIGKSDKQGDLHLNAQSRRQTHAAYGSLQVGRFASETETHLAFRWKRFKDKLTLL